VTEDPGLEPAAWNELWRTTGGDREFLAELLRTFFDDTAAQLAVLHRSLGDRQAEEFRRAAHSLKSNSATFGALRLSRMCRELEALAAGGSLEGAEARLALTEAEYERIRPLLEAESARLEHPQ
jgi:HPt (histidine-containing phosphotransfer) domain-containing protein